eukprot:6474004-Pyramimonas_sp.AAC.1
MSRAGRAGAPDNLSGGCTLDADLEAAPQPAKPRGRGRAVSGGGRGRAKRARVGDGNLGDSLVGPLLIRTVSIFTAAAKGVCGICGKKESPAVPFPDMKFPGEKIQKFQNSCSFHANGYVKGQ